jgi:DNA-directed RNA polymerase subunit RPC12/RpoP
MRDTRTWALENHLCKACGGRILRCVKGNGITGGGNPVFKCADCGKAVAAMGPEALCWCGFSHRGNRDNAYTCQPFSILDERPELLSAFRACGCDPERGEVGIMLERDLRSNDIAQGREHSERPAGAEG